MRVLFVALLSFGWISSVHAEAMPYRGPHPIDLEGHWHDEASVHVHDDLPVGRAPFAEIDGVLVVLASPRAYGYRGDVWTYRGAHPLGPAFNGDCGIVGEHAHAFAPEGSFRREPSGTYVFSGALRGGVRTHVPGRVAPDVAIAVSQPTPPAAVIAPCRVYENANGMIVSVPIYPGYPCGGTYLQQPVAVRNSTSPTPPEPPAAPVAPVAAPPRARVRMGAHRTQ